MNARDSYFDNAKLALILLVVLGHALELLPTESARSLWRLLYLFHMPCFVFITGYFSKNPRQGRHIVELLFLYIAFQLLYLLFQKGALHKEADWQLGYPLYAYWYLPACALWKAFGPALGRLRWALPLSLAAGLLVGYDDTIARAVSLSRVIVFLPFFLLGMKAEKKHFDAIKRIPPPIALLAFCAAMALLRLFMAELPSDLFLHAAPYAALELTMWYAFAYRLLLYGLALLLGVAFFALIPRRALRCSPLGARTMQVFLLHPFVMQLLRHIRVWEFVSAPWMAALYLLGALGLGLLLSLKPFGAALFPFRWVMRRAYDLHD